MFGFLSQPQFPFAMHIAADPSSSPIGWELYTLVFVTGVAGKRLTYKQLIH